MRIVRPREIGRPEVRLPRGGEGLVRPLEDPLGADVDPAPGRHLAEHRQAERLEAPELVPGRPAGDEQRVGDQHARRRRMRPEDADGLSALDEQRLVGLEREEARDEGAEGRRVARRLPRAAVDDELLRVLGHLGVEVVEEHPEGRLGLPRLRVERLPARCADGGEVAAELLDARLDSGHAGHSSAPTSPSTRATRSPFSDRDRHGLDVAREGTVLDHGRGQGADEVVGRAGAGAGLERGEELDPLRACEQLDRERALDVREHLPALEGGRVPHRDVIFLARARRDRVDAGGMAQHLVLAHEGSGHVLRDHEAGVEPPVVREEGGEAVGERRVREPLDPPLGDGRELGQGHRGGVERERERLTVEVAVGDELPALDEDEGVVGGRVQLDGDRRLRVGEEVPARPVDLWGAAEGVRVLHLVAPAVRLEDGGALQQTKDVRGARPLALERAELVDLGEEAPPRALQRLEGERARDVRRPGESLRPNDRQRADGGHELGPVDERQAFLGLQLDRLEAGADERLGPREDVAVDLRVALADQREREVRERGEVARRADGAPARHERGHARVQAAEEQLHGLDPRARVPLGERVRAQEHRPPHHLVGVRLADAARVASQEPELELRGELGRDRLRDEPAEAGVDPVRVLAPGLGSALDELARRLQLLPASIRELRGPAPDGDVPDVRRGEVVPRQRHGGRRRHRGKCIAGG